MSHNAPCSEPNIEDYHLAITVSVLLIYGMEDKFVSLEEEEWMQEVRV